MTPEQFWARVDKSGECWTWNGAKHPSGAGQARCGGRTVYAHRLAYELTCGPTAEPINRALSCERSCVRPDHMRVGPLSNAAALEALHRPAAERFWEKVRKAEGCWEWVGFRGEKGYGAFKFNGRAITASRFSYELHYGPIPDGLWVLHHCDNPPCVRPDHLYAGTLADNVRDAIERKRLKGQSFPGERHPMAKLTEAAVREIRALLAQGHTQTAIARSFGVTPSTIGGIARGVRWTHV